MTTVTDCIFGERLMPNEVFHKHGSALFPFGPAFFLPLLPCFPWIHWFLSRVSFFDKVANELVIFGTLLVNIPDFYIDEL